MLETIIIGGGVIGLTTAYELALQGGSVTVIDRQQVGQEASWAGAGMLPPGRCSGPQAVRELAKRSALRWGALSAEIRERTGIDNGYLNCGALQVSLPAPALNTSDTTYHRSFCVAAEIVAWQAEGVEVESLDGPGLRQFEKKLSETIELGYRLPTMSQVRNPRHLQGLKAACLDLNVTFLEHVAIDRFVTQGQRIQGAAAGSTVYSADHFVLAGGSWSGELANFLQLPVDIVPVRGQIVLMKMPHQVFSHILESGARYLVPRADGHVLIGSTEEHVGFVKANTPEQVQDLIDFAVGLVPALSAAEVVRTWSGLRPSAVRGFPYLGPVENYENLILATGHFRDGLSQSPVTAQIVCDFIRHRPTPFDTTALAIEHFRPSSSSLFGP